MPSEKERTSPPPPPRPESAAAGEEEETSRTNDGRDASSVDLLALAASALASSVVASLPIHELSTRRSSGGGGGGTGRGGATSSDSNDDASSSAVRAVPVNHGQKNARLKLDGTVVTDADGAAQHIIVGALREVSRRMRIVGEESSVEMERGRSFRSSSAGTDDDENVGDGDNGIGASVGKERKKKIFDVAEKEVRARYRTFRGRDGAGGGGAGEGSAGRKGAGSDGREGEEGSPPPPPRPGGLTSRPDDVVSADPTRISVFVDPLDGTSSYAKGKYEAVSTLVGILIDNVPIFGVICKPFGMEGRPSAFGSGCHAVYGGTLLGGAYVAGGDEIELSRRHRERRGRTSTTTTEGRGGGAAGSTPSSSTAPEAEPSTNAASGEPDDDKDDDSHPPQVTVPSSSDRRPRAVISASRSKGIVFDFVQHLASRHLLHPEFVHASGAGEKALRILTGVQNESLWFFPKPGTSLWDVAAADALLRSIGGKLTDKRGRDIDYGRGRTDAENWEGIVACNDEWLHGEVINLFREGNWNEREEG